MTALTLFAAAVIVGWLSGEYSLAHRTQRVLSTVSWVLCFAGAILLVIVGSIALASTHPVAWDAGGLLGASALRLDRLSGLFLVISFGVATPALLSAISSQAAHRARLSAAIGAVLLALALAISAGNLFALLVGWEGLGFAFYLAVGYDRDRVGRARASVMASVFSKASGAALLVGGSILFAQTHTLSLAGFAHAHQGVAHAAAYALLILGFVVKVGLMPVHLWLPPSYAAAPGPARALLAGAAVNVGFYGLWRTIDILGVPPAWLACVVLVLGGLTALLGISHAAVHADLAYLVAWSSVENAGIILSGFGVALVGEVVHLVPLIAVGLVAATAQVCAHALGKSLLFVSTSAIEEACGTTDLDLLRAVTARQRVSGTGLVIGALTLAGVPLTAGFASEWLILESLMQQFRVDSLPLDLCLAVAGVLVALTIGVASIAFVRLIALTAFGQPTHTSAKPRDLLLERSWFHRVGTALLILGCLGVAVVAPLELQLIARGISPIVGGAAFSAVTDAWILQPVFAGFSALSPTWLWIVIPGYVILIGALSVLVSGGRFLKVRRVTPWMSASPGVKDGHGYTSFGYANPIRRVLASVLLTRGRLREETIAVDKAEEIPTSDETESIAAAGSRNLTVKLGYTVDVVDVVEVYLYRPLIPVGRAIVNTAKRLQSGRLDAYMAYMLVAVLAILAVVTALAGG
jgi:formate hydrogenlyase subunit 3/multisubunit Na+/H+ antiporter MnhD subunit